MIGTPNLEVDVFIWEVGRSQKFDGDIHTAFLFSPTPMLLDMLNFSRSLHIFSAFFRSVKNWISWNGIPII